jgi:hypothetical protein
MMTLRPPASIRVIVGATCVVVLAAACGSSDAAAPPTSPSTSTTAPPTTTTAPTTTTPPVTAPPAPTTTAPAIPPAPQPSPEVAANALVGYWASGNRATALRVATPQAVATLFAVPYPNGLANNRGCTSAFAPIICTFGAPGGGPVNAPIYQVYVTQAPGGWYVSSVQIES